MAPRPTPTPSSKPLAVAACAAVPAAHVHARGLCAFSLLSMSLLVYALLSLACLPIRTCTAQLLIAPSNPSYPDLPPTNDGVPNPNTNGPAPDSTASLCCPGGLPATTPCTGSRCYPRNCAQCNCNAQNLCPLPLTQGTGPFQTEGTVNGKLRNMVRDPNLFYTLACLNQQDFAPSVLGACGGAYDEARIPNKIKGFINWVDDIGNSLTGQLSPSFPTHLGMGRRYGVSDLEIQRMLAFIAPYAGFDKVFAGFGAWLGQYANCSVLQPDPKNPDMLTPVPGQPIGVGSPLTFGCPVGQCHNAVYEYTGYDVDAYSKTQQVANLVTSLYQRLGYASVMVDELSRAWMLPNLSLKAKYYAVLTLESQYRASPKAEIQELTSIMTANGVTTRDEIQGFFDFSNCYTGYTRAQAEMHTVLDAASGGSGSTTKSSSSSSKPSGVAVAALILSIFNIIGCLAVLYFFLVHKKTSTAGTYTRASAVGVADTSYALMSEE